jgi:hypothetical protein
MRYLPSLRGNISPLFYAALAPLLIFSQHLIVAATFWSLGASLNLDAGFWLLPMRRLALLPRLSAWAAGLAFAFSLVVAWAIAVLSFRRAQRSGLGYLLAAFSIVPALQIAAVAILIAMPSRPEDARALEATKGVKVAHVIQGVLAGIAIIVLAVLISAVTFGAYGWSLFVMTPFLVGVTTAYLANRETALQPGQTIALVMSAAALGTLALVSFALEGFVCILLAAPLGAIAAAIGGAIGRAIANLGHRRGRPLLSVALLPAMFAIEAAIPPNAPIDIQQTIDVGAPPSAVWRALTSNEPIGPRPFLIAEAGFSYPIRGRLLGEGIGAERRGDFSTGVARERVTEWVPDRRLSFVVLSQPPMMEEMSPYRRVHAPHVSGYFETVRTSFDLAPLPGGRTRLTARANHVLRLDPALYWEPMARWAINQNVARVLRSIKDRAEANGNRQRR